jgi:hypothetical protein
MQLPTRGVTQVVSGRTLLSVLLIVAAGLLFWFAFPGVQAGPPAPPAAPAWPDPNTGFWVELVVVTIITAITGIVLHFRRKPNA